MTRKRRLMAIFEGSAPDRSAVKVWGVSPKAQSIHPGYDAVRDLAVEKTDLVVGSGSAFNIYAGTRWGETTEHFTRPTKSPDWNDAVTIIHTPMGDLHGIFLQSTKKHPGYDIEYCVKEPEDIRKLLSLPYDTLPVDADSFFKTEREIGDAGIVMFGLDHPAYALQRMTGSENFALWSIEQADLMQEAIDVFAERVRSHAKAALAAGIRGVFGYVGPELCIPPLVSPQTFERFVFDIDKPLSDLIHDGGGRVWMHCHGRMHSVIERFADEGIDVLNPVEPPPMGDVTMVEAFELVGDRMGLEGNIETHDIITATKEQLRAKIYETLSAGKGRRMILCPCSGYNENPEPTAREIENWLFYIEEGVRVAQEMARM